MRNTHGSESRGKAQFRPTGCPAAPARPPELGGRPLPTGPRPRHRDIAPNAGCRGKGRGQGANAANTPPLQVTPQPEPAARQGGPPSTRTGSVSPNPCGLPRRPASGGGDRLDAPGVVVGGLVDEGAHGMGGHRVRRVRAERHRLARELRLVRIRRQDHGHAIVYWRHGRVGRGREDRAGLDRLPRRPFGQRSRVRRPLGHRPMLPQPGEGERPAVLQPEQPRLLLPAPAGPLVEAVGRDQAAPRAPGGRKEGLALAVSARALISL